MTRNIELKITLFSMAPQKGWDGITHCQVIAIEPYRHIAYTHRGEASGVAFKVLGF